MASAPKFRVIQEKNLRMRARDGATLVADAYRPDAPGKFPVLVVRTPYDKDNRLTEMGFFPPRGYVVVVQDCRGRYGSEGEFYCIAKEGPDTYDTVEWSATLPWSNGKVGMVGQSYRGVTQLMGAPLRPPHLVAMAPTAAPVLSYENCVWRRGVLELGWIVSYMVMLSRNELDRKKLDALKPILNSYMQNPEAYAPLVKPECFRWLPVRSWGELLKEGAPYFREMLENFKYGPFWSSWDLRTQLDEIGTPMLHINGWYDGFLVDTLSLYTGLRSKARTQHAREGQKLILGPWGHIYPFAVPNSGGAGDIDFGPEAAIETHAAHLRFFDHYLKGEKNGLLEEAPIRLFVMGENRWRDEHEWPLKRTKYTNWYLSSGGHANSLGGDGALIEHAPSDENPDTFIYDPNDPVPTRGGNMLSLEHGAFDQTPVERRNDVLVYTSDVLEHDLEVTGPVSVTLHAATSAPDTDWTAKLVDVRFSGYAQNIAEGIIRARFRESLTNPTLLVANKAYEYKIDLWATSHVFKAGHRIRLEISSSNFPHFDRNANSGLDIGVDRVLLVAQQTVFHDRSRPSHVTLPVIPR